MLLPTKIETKFKFLVSKILKHLRVSKSNEAFLKLNKKPAPNYLKIELQQYIISQ